MNEENEIDNELIKIEKLLHPAATRDEYKVLKTIYEILCLMNNNIKRGKK